MLAHGMPNCYGINEIDMIYEKIKSWSQYDTEVTIENIFKGEVYVRTFEMALYSA